MVHGESRTAVPARTEFWIAATGLQQQFLDASLGSRRLNSGTATDVHGNHANAFNIGLLFYLD